MKVGFTASCFDLLHAGHIAMLAEAKTQCDYLIVGLQTDPSIDGRKPKPIQSVYERWLQLSAVKYVDQIIPYDDENDLLNLLKTTRIDVRIIGEDYLDREFTGKGFHAVYYNRRRHYWSSTELKGRIKQ
jgi:glycerol-3-phosphate cytidylyltransferase